MGGGERGEEVVLKRTYRTFGAVSAVCVGCNELHCETKRGGVRFKITRGFVIQTDVCEGDVMRLEKGDTSLECTGVFLFAACSHRLDMYVVVRCGEENHDVLVSGA